jgi:hypothetical protein
MLATIETDHPRSAVRNLGVLSYVCGVTHHSYKTDATCEDVLRAGYFDGVFLSLISPGDWLFVSASDGPLILWARECGLSVTLERVR